MHFMLTWLLARRLELRFNFKFFNQYHSQTLLLWYFFEKFLSYQTVKKQYKYLETLL